ncbi:MAG: putative photosynthetic complex assembly protein PuhE [Hydrogenophaga sp.]
MSDIALAALFAVFIWWFSTGIVLLLNGMQRRAYKLSLFASSALAVAALVALNHTADLTTTAAIYCAFTCALLIWGWHELSFLTGWITGPRTTALPAAYAQGREGRRFIESVRAILWHELGILLVGGLLIAMTWGAPNQVGTWTFVVLWSMRTSAKLNLFLGVRNLSEEFLPPHLVYLSSFFRRRAMNLLFPFVVVGASLVLGWMVTRAFDPAADAATVLGLTLVGTMLALAILEHGMLVLPVSTTALWRWAMTKRQTAAGSDEPSVASSTDQAVSGPMSKKLDSNEQLLHAR